MVYGLSKKLILLRQQNKLSQSEVARRIGISEAVKNLVSMGKNLC